MKNNTFLWARLLMLVAVLTILGVVQLRTHELSGEVSFKEMVPGVFNETGKDQFLVYVDLPNGGEVLYDDILLWNEVEVGDYVWVKVRRPVVITRLYKGIKAELLWERE